MHNDLKNTSVKITNKEYGSMLNGTATQETKDKYNRNERKSIEFENIVRSFLEVKLRDYDYQKGVK